MTEQISGNAILANLLENSKKLKENAAALLKQTTEQQQQDDDIEVVMPAKKKAQEIVEKAELGTDYVKPDKQVKPTTGGLVQQSGALLEGATNLSAKIFAKNLIIPKIDEFVKDHLNKPVTKDDVQKFFTKILETLKTKEIINSEASSKYNQAEEVEKKTIEKRTGVTGFFLGDKETISKALDPSKFEKLVNSTHQLLEHTTPNLGTTEKLWFGLSNLFKEIGLKSLSKVCMNQIAPENLKALDTINLSISEAFKNMSKEINPNNKTLPKIGEFTAKIAEERATSPQKSLGKT